MSSSCRSRFSGFGAWRSTHGLPWLCVCLSAGPAFGAQYYNQPSVSVTAETDSNPAFDPAVHAHYTEGYTGEVQTIFGIRTPTSDTTIRPRLSYQDFPGDSGDFNRLEEYLDLRENYHTQRSSFNFLGNYDHRSDLKAAFPDAQFDPLANNQTVPETGHVTVGGTRTQVVLAPDYTYQLTQRMKVGASGLYQAIDYSPQTLAGRVNFNYYFERAFVGWSITPRSDIAVGGFGSQYTAKDFVSRTNSYGVTLDYTGHLSRLFTNTVSLAYQKNDINQQLPVVFSGSVNSWTANYTLTYEGRNYHVTFIGGRLLTPSGAGGMYATDQVRLQYDKNLTQRLSLVTAARWLRDQALRTNSTLGNLEVVNRHFLRLEASLKYHLTPTWYLTGGYQYGNQRYQVEPNSATNNQLSLSVNYQALGPQN